MFVNLIIPNQYVKSYKDVDLLQLKKNNIKLFILDIDNTLVKSNSNKISEDAIRFVKQIKSAKIIPVVISNNVENRVKKFTDILNVDYYSFALKPLKKSYKIILQKYNVDSNEVVIIGDQLLTDIIGGNIMNMHTILVDPISEKDNIFGSINRVAENTIFKYLEIKKLLKKGKYYDNM
ncbi:MAG: YqeG family HAD IIIA-type phosphatase [Erysipelotrichaceae bacterium]|nr:YqeG family HAD IIIA-type phosphatase [Erysipelotrichaceae bacterium]